MSIIAENKGGTRETIPAGNYVARCYSMVHMGTSIENIQGIEKSLNKVRIGWELPTEMRVFKEENGEQPMVISQEYTLSMHEKSNLRKMLESWRGKSFTEEQATSFDITALMGISCMLNVIHKTSGNGSVYSNIASVSSIPKGLECPPQIHEGFEFNFQDKFSNEVVESFPDFIKDRIKASDEYKEVTNDAIPVAPVADNVDPINVDDLPF